MLLSLLLYLLLLICLFIYLWLRRRYNIWKRLKIPYKQPTMFLGNVKNILKGLPHYTHLFDEHYKYFKSQGERHFGIFVGLFGVYIPIDPTIVKDILSKDSEYFTQRGIYYDKEHDPLSANLVTLGGKEWKNIRSKISCVFTKKRLKETLKISINCTDELLKNMEEKLLTSNELDMSSLSSEFVINVIGSSFFGIECKNSKFANEAIKIFKPGYLHMLKYHLVQVFPGLAKIMRVRMTQKSITEFYFKCIEDIVRYRNENGVVRNDYMQVLIDIYNRENAEDRISMNEVASLALMFFVGGYDTTYSALIFALIELAHEQETQNKLRNNIRKAFEKHDKKFSFEFLNDIPYLEQVILETLRKYPIIPIVVRQCTKEYEVPGTKVVLPKNTQIVILSRSMHFDPEYFVEPDKFLPERFSEEFKSDYQNLNFYPFGGGSRYCIGASFARLEMKAFLALLLNQYKFLPPENHKNVLEFDPLNFLLHSKQNMYLKVEKL